ncbi:MAG: pyridine nucleotide-disulfide oxidoreductase [Pimelobacter sp.]|nr:pyridine nucleotide-disulfide oxidoreductase [Pimelobacter sp.]
MPDLLLVGAGHSHLHLIAHARALTTAGYRVRVLAPRFFDYSGLASATAAGSVPADAGRIDVRALAQRHDVELVEDTLSGLDLRGRCATTTGGSRLAYDVVSLNIGSVAAAPGMEVGDGVLRVKPLSDLAALAARLAATPDAGLSVVGGGSTGIELAAHLSVRAGVGTVRLLESGPEIGADLPPRARRRLVRLLDRRGVEVCVDAPVRSVGAHQVGLDDGRTLGHDIALLATGLAAPRLVSELGIGDVDGIPVTTSLQHVDQPDTYAVGDCAHFTPQPLARIGVHGVRQGSVLLASLLARAAGQPLPTYTPQGRALAILDLGDGVGLAVRGRLWWYGGAALRLKRWIDRRWLARYR